MSLDLFCFLPGQRFVYGFTDPREAAIIFTQNTQPTFRSYLLDESGYRSNGYPFSYDPQSGNSDHSCIISLRDISSGTPVTLSSTAPMTPILRGWSGTLALTTAEVSNFLSGKAERPAALCVDLINNAGQRTSPFRAPIVLRGTGDLGATVEITQLAANILYLPEITGYSGGTVTDADNIATSFRTAGTVFIFIIDGVMSMWRMDDATDDTDTDAGIIKLLDTGKNLIRVAGI